MLKFKYIIFKRYENRTIFPELFLHMLHTFYIVVSYFIRFINVIRILYNLSSFICSLTNFVPVRYYLQISVIAYAVIQPLGSLLMHLLCLDFQLSLNYHLSHLN